MNFTKLPVILLCGQAGVGKDTVGQMIVDARGFTKFAQADTIKDIAKDAFGFTDEQLWGPSEFRNAMDFEFAPGQLKYEGMFLYGEDPGDDGISKVVDAFVNRTGASRQGIVGYVDAFMKAMKTFADSKNGLTPRIVLQMLGTEVGRAYSPDIWVGGALRKAEQVLVSGAAGVVVTDGRFRNEIFNFRRFGGYAVKIIGDSSLAAATHQSEAEIAAIPDQFYDIILHNDKNVGLEGLRGAVKMVLNDLLTPYRISAY